MTIIRKAAVAGSFYPADAEQLLTQIQDLMSQTGATDMPVPKVIIVPHAGYQYSGALAAQGYARLRPAASRIKRVILMGPCHKVGVDGLALSGADYFSTPLGRIAIDKEAAAQIIDLPQVQVFDSTHEAEHSLEVHIPFLQALLDDFKILPVVVGQATSLRVIEVLEGLWGGEETLIVISSDLSHFLDYENAQLLDARTCKAISNFSPGRLERGGACGHFALKGLLHFAKQRKMTVETLGMHNSGDTAGSKDRVVGYGAWALYEPDEPPKYALSHSVKLLLNKLPAKRKFEEKTKELLKLFGQNLLEFADSSIRHTLKTGKPASIKMKSIPAELSANGACFVTLKTVTNQLRGCIGSPQAYRSLILDVATNAFKAAFKDTRFKPVTLEEYETLVLSISVLSPQSSISFVDEADLLSQLRPGIDGLVISDGGKTALFLPSVWDSLSTPEMFLSQLKRKAGMKQGYWSDNFKAKRFISEEVSSKAT